MVNQWRLFVQRYPALGRRSIYWPLGVAAVIMAVGVGRRLVAEWYSGPPEQGSFNAFIFGSFGAYSDVTSLYVRDQLWTHPIPYFNYPLEYPVGIGLLSWLANWMTSGMVPYYLLTAAVLVACGLGTIWLARQFEDANPWLLALWPTLALYIVMNWDALSLLPTVAALLLFRRDCDGWGALALTAAVWAKFFPIVLVPLVIWDRGLRGRWRDAGRIAGIFGLGSLLINAPFALQLWPPGLRESWLYFFRFNQERPIQNWSANLWNLVDGLGLSTGQINFLSALLLLAGLALVLGLLALAHHQGHGLGRDLLLPAAVALIGWFLFINKVYSVQYSWWIAVLFALIAARSTLATSLAAAFAAADLVYCMAIFNEFYLGWSARNAAAADWMYAQAIWPATLLRETLTLAIIVWAAWQLLRPFRSRRPDLSWLDGPVLARNGERTEAEALTR